MKGLKMGFLENFGFGREAVDVASNHEKIKTDFDQAADSIGNIPSESHGRIREFLKNLKEQAQ